MASPDRRIGNRQDPAQPVVEIRRGQLVETKTMRRIAISVLLVATMTVSAATTALAQHDKQADYTIGRPIPARTIPLPDTVSPAMREWIAHPASPMYESLPGTDDQWCAGGQIARDRAEKAAGRSPRVVPGQDRTAIGGRRELLSGHARGAAGANRRATRAALARRSLCLQSGRGRRGRRRAVGPLRPDEGALGRLSDAARSSVSGRAGRCRGRLPGFAEDL